MTFTEEVQLLLDSHAEIATKQPEALSLLNSVHKALFGTNVKQGCGDCTVKAFTSIRKFIFLQQQKKDFNLETMVKFKDRNFVIKDGKVLTMPGASYTNDNLTDEKAVDILTRYPNLVKHFAKYPGSETPTKELDFDLLGTSPAIAPKIKTIPPPPGAKGRIQTQIDNPPHKRNGLKTMVDMLPGESTAEYADRIGMSERNVLRYVKAGTLPNYDPETKLGFVGEEEPAKEEVAAPVIETPLRYRLTADGLLRFDNDYNGDKILEDLASIEEEDVRAEDTLKVIQFFNGELADEAEVDEVAGQLSSYLKEYPVVAPVEEAPVISISGNVEGDLTATTDIVEGGTEAPLKAAAETKVKSDSKIAKTKEKAADAPEGPATV